MKSSMVRIINSGFISKTALEGTGC